ncbi:hypothetical protein L1987_86243 [Smallanthus sonchifolius]|uniref:Uncharacterized protein n=1 Tax=Smallanthus sonchifolius TaxID=185202 RepID=A0ACB8XZE3_9ASTR|nr:hypothetical protein L1987_86243 [Smallanthus sonchifolius]
MFWRLTGLSTVSLDQPLISSPNFASKNKEEELMYDATSKNQIIDISSDLELDELEREDEPVKEAQLPFKKRKL